MHTHTVRTFVNTGYPARWAWHKAKLPCWESNWKPFVHADTLLHTCTHKTQKLRCMAYVYTDARAYCSSSKVVLLTMRLWSPHQLTLLPWYIGASLPVLSLINKSKESLFVICHNNPEFGKVRYFFPKSIANKLSFLVENCWQYLIHILTFNDQVLGYLIPLEINTRFVV